MSQFVLANQSVYLGGYDLRGRSNSVALTYAADPVDNTNFGSGGSRSRLGGLKMCAAQLEGFVDFDATDAALFAGVGVVNTPFSIGCGAEAVGDIAFFFNAMNADALVFGGKVGEAAQMKAGAENTGGPLVKGTIMLNSRAAALTSTGDGTSAQLGAVSASQRLYSVVHVWNAGTGSFTVKVQSDVTDDFTGSETDRITHTAFSAVGAEIKSVAGAITDEWWRIDYTISGASPQFKAFIALGII